MSSRSHRILTLSTLAGFAAASLAPVSASAELVGKVQGRTIRIEQIVDDGPITILDDGPANAIRILDSFTDVVLAPATNLKVELLDDSGSSLTTSLANPIDGKIDIDLGDGTRTLTFADTQTRVGKDLRVRGGDGDQLVQFNAAGGADLAGSLRIELGEGDDTVENATDVMIARDLKMRGVNYWENGQTLDVGRNFDMRVNRESEPTEFDNDGVFNVGRNFRYVGSKASDSVLLNDTVLIGGKAQIDLKENDAGAQYCWFNGTTQIGGSLACKAGDAPSNSFNSAGTTIYGSKKIDVRFGDASNSAVFLGTGNVLKAVSYRGGDLTDSVTFNLAGTSATKLKAKLDDGDDSLMLNAAAVLGAATIDFGKGIDSFTNNLAVPGNTVLRLKNLP